jgi:hypothetical protein
MDGWMDGWYFLCDYLWQGLEEEKEGDLGGVALYEESGNHNSNTARWMSEFRLNERNPALNERPLFFYRVPSKVP